MDGSGNQTTMHDLPSSNQSHAYASSPSSRTERIQQLRAEHQRRHRERQGQYPLDAQEEAYERQLQEYERQVFHHDTYYCYWYMKKKLTTLNALMPSSGYVFFLPIRIRTTFVNPLFFWSLLELRYDLIIKFLDGLLTVSLIHLS